MIEPEGWGEATIKEKEKWVKDAEDMLAEKGVVPEGSREALAVIWDYGIKSKKRWNGTISPNQAAIDEEDSAEVA